jgi:hypothetical protein
MAESFLEEQLRRIREMSEQMSRVQTLYSHVEHRTDASDARRSSPIETSPARRPSSRTASRRRGR